MRGWRCGWLIGAVFLLAGLPSQADDLRPSWQCLPDDTAAVVRVPGLTSFVEAVRTRTKLGGTLLRPDRLERVWEFLTEGDDDLAGDFEESLRKYGLELSDLLAAGDQELGFAIVARRREGLPPLAMLLGWAEPGVESGEKILEAAKRRIEEAADDSPGLERIDLSLAGRDVLSVLEPVMGLDLRDLELDRLAEEGSDAGDYAARYAELQERVRNAKPVQTGQTHSYLALHHGRLLFGATIQAARSAGKGPIDPQSFEPLCGGEDSREIFEAFLAAHESDGEPALARVFSEPAITAANLPAGLPLAELVFVPPAFFAALEESPATADRMAQLGLDDLGGIVWRHAFVEGCWRSSLAATLPAPRHGMLSVLDQECDTCDVPSFVTSETVGFTQISLDLGVAFLTIRELLVADPAAEQLANMFMVADVQSQAWLGADVASVLTGLGSRHWVLTFPPRITAALAEARASAKSGDDARPVTADAVALVWEIDDETPFMKLLGRLAPLAGGDLQEEQGFRGLRLPGGDRKSVV